MTGTEQRRPFNLLHDATAVDAPPGLPQEVRAVHSAMVDAVLGGGGLARVAELAADAAGGPVAVVVPRLAAATASGDSHAATDVSTLEHWVAERVGGRPAAVPRDVLAEVPIHFLEELAGIVALLRSKRPPRTEASEFLHAAAAAALMGLAIEDAKEEVQQSLRGSLLEELRSGRQLNGAEIARRAARLGCDLSGGAVILCAEGEMPRLGVATITAEHPGALAQQLDGNGPNGSPLVYAALSATVGDGSPEATLASARRIARQLRRRAIVGVSSFHADPTEMGCAVREAELVLDVLRNSDAAITIADEIGSGTYKLLFRLLASHPEEVRSFYEATIAPVVRYEALYGTALLHTLQAYLDANCNMNATAAAIFAHRNTVAYRLERVHELTGLDPMLSEDRERLGLGIKIHRIIAPPRQTADGLDAG